MFNLKVKIALLMLLALIIALAKVNGVSSQQPRIIKISHQFPASTGDEGDFRDRLCRKFAAEVEKRTKGQLKFEIYPSSSLFKATAQVSAMRKGALDMGLIPISYGSGEIPEANLGLMPALVTSYEQGLRWKNAPIGKKFAEILARHNIIILTWVWQGGGIASTKGKLVAPEDFVGIKIRGGSREMDMMLKEAGASVVNMPSSEIYNAMQSGVIDAALTSSTSLISYRLYEFAKNVTTARKKSFWYMLEPLVMSKSLFDSLTPEQQKIVLEVGASLEKFGMEEAKKDDQRMAEVYAKAGAKVHDMDEKTFERWREIAKRTAYEDFVKKVNNGKELLDMALSVK